MAATTHAIVAGFWNLCTVPKDVRVTVQQTMREQTDLLELAINKPAWYSARQG